jgi:hypothetical protein
MSEVERMILAVAVGVVLGICFEQFLRGGK